MKKPLSLILICILTLSFFGCKKEEPPKEEKETKQEQVSVPTNPNSEEDFLSLAPEHLQTIFDKIQNEFYEYQIPMGYGTWENNKLCFYIYEFDAVLQLGYSSESQSSVISIRQDSGKDVTFMKEACVRVSDPSLTSITNEMVNMVVENGRVEFNGNIYSQEENVFSIQIDAAEKKEYKNAVIAANSVYSSYSFDATNRLQLALNAYAQKKHEKFNSLISRGNYTSKHTFNEEVYRFIENEDGRVEISLSSGKDSSLSYADEQGCIAIFDANSQASFNPNCQINRYSSFVDSLSLNKLTKLELLRKDNTLDCLVTMTNTAMIITIDGCMIDDDMNYSCTVIVTEDEINVSERVYNDSFEQKENYLYSFENVESLDEIKEKLYSEEFDFKSLRETLKDLL